MKTNGFHWQRIVEKLKQEQYGEQSNVINWNFDGALLVTTVFLEHGFFNALVVASRCQTDVQPSRMFCEFLLYMLLDKMRLPSKVEKSVLMSYGRRPFVQIPHAVSNYLLQKKNRKLSFGILLCSDKTRQVRVGSWPYVMRHLRGKYSNHKIGNMLRFPYHVFWKILIAYGNWKRNR